jgi:hypothetical protein
MINQPLAVQELAPSPPLFITVLSIDALGIEQRGTYRRVGEKDPEQGM